jgi:CspA family cold shock protein
MSTGTVKHVVDAKGYAFIAPDEGGRDVFAHVSNCDDGDLFVGDRVQFDVEIDRRRGREHAVNVRVLENA